MKPNRFASALLILAATTALAACGDADKATTAGSTPSASTSVSTSVAPTSAAASAPAAAAGASDKKLCETVKKAGDDMKAELLKVAMAGEPSAADFKKILIGLKDQLSAAASAGGDSKVATAVQQFNAEAAKAAAAADPAEAADNPAFEKAGTDITAACKAVGVSVNF
ncbi:hypothetical protein V6V47_18395 [Micromonospora sp. CPCC 205539]|uniref:hypothetical protein n=1 Tax=Micromonospora sp. CPCC 205539 TaxID=3122408 RepID=UPI002FF1E371